MELNNRNSITFLRIFAMILILLCHIVQEYDNLYIQMTAQIFNVGVTVFIVISGYLYGNKEINEKYILWLIKRAKRILIPLYVFMFYLLIVNLIKHNNIQITNWLAYMFNIQGLQLYVHGAEHLWYLTIIMVCYLITPILNKYRKYIVSKNIAIIIPIFILLQIGISYFVDAQIGIYLIYIYVYILAYVIGVKWNKVISKKILFVMIITGGSSLVLRFLSRLIFDDTILYNVMIVGYSQAIVAFSIFYIFIYLGRKFKSNKFINYIDSISFDIYLVHYMYMVGPLRTMGATSNFIFNTIITLVISFITAILLNITCKFIYSILDLKIINRKQNNRSNITE